MKPLPLSVSLLLGLIACSAAAPGRNTLDFYLSDPSKYLGNSINLSVSHVDPIPYRGQLDNVVFFRVYTSGENGQKSIPLAVDAQKSKEFADYYGTKISTKASDMHPMVARFRYVDPTMEQTMQTSGLWFVGIMQGAYFIDATTEGQLDTVFNWYPEKTTAVKSGKSIIRVSAKETTQRSLKLNCVTIDLMGRNSCLLTMRRLLESTERRKKPTTSNNSASSSGSRPEFD
jgi:hypothetical protein